MKMIFRIKALINMLLNIALKKDVGGQAVIEGVLMKGPSHWGLALREPTGNVWKKSWKCSDWYKKGVWKLPIFRGFASMVEMLRVGMKALSISADVNLGEKEELSPFEMVVAILFALVAVLIFFVALPMYASEYMTSQFLFSNFTKNILEGLLRGIIFIGYIAIIGIWKDMRQVFCYHGAEHKAINAFEAGADLVPIVVEKYSRIHKRCGTSFLIVVIFISIVIFSFIGEISFVWRVLSRVLLLPLVIGISYEFIKSASKSETWGSFCIMPALSLQYITTREPTLEQIEIALVALDLALNSKSELLMKGINGITDGFHS